MANATAARVDSTQPQPLPSWHCLRFLAHEGSVETYFAIRSRHALYSYLPHL
jgi:hypothetical protein